MGTLEQRRRRIGLAALAPTLLVLLLILAYPIVDSMLLSLASVNVAGTGFAIGVDRLALALDAARFDSRADAALAMLGDAAMRRGMALAAEMLGISTL